MGITYSIYEEWFPAKPTITAAPHNIPDLSGKVMIVTGANTGIGKETAKALLIHNARVYIAARDPDKAKHAINVLRQETGKEGVFLKLDLSDLESVKAAAEEFNGKEQELHVLFNNAGVMIPPIGPLTTQGYDLQFGTNVLGHFYLTKLLMPALLKGAKSSPDGKARVVNTSSFASLLTYTIDFDTLQETEARNKMGTMMLYCQSKLGNILFSNELARRYGDQGIVSTSLNPGNLDSDLMQHVPSLATKFMRLTILWPPSYGALTQLWAGTSLEGVRLNGQYLIPWVRVSGENPAGKDPALAQQLWDWKEDEVSGGR